MIRFLFLDGQTCEEIKVKLNKRPHLAKKKVLFHHDNAPAHSSAIATAKLVELRYELLPHPPYSADLAPYDFFLFPNMKKWMGRKRFTSKKEVIKGAWSLLTACNLTLISSHIFPSKKRNRITDRYCSFCMVANKHELNDLQKLSKQNYSINLSEMLTVIVGKMALNNDIHMLRQWCHQSINTATYQTALVI